MPRPPRRSLASSCSREKGRLRAYPVHSFISHPCRLMTVSRDNDAKPRVISNNFSVLMADADDDEGGSSGHSSVKASPSFPSLSATAGAAGASKKERASFAAVSFSQVATNDTSSWQTFRKPAASAAASAQGPSKPQGSAGGEGDGMYRGSSSTLMNRSRPVPSSSGQQTPRQHTAYRRQPSGGSERAGGGKNLPMLPEVTLELYDFPSSLRTGDLHGFVHKAAGVDGHYRLKWQNDTSCWIILDSPELADTALAHLQAVQQADGASISVRPYHADNVKPSERPPRSESQA